jgi:hypothetical protein
MKKLFSTLLLSIPVLFACSSQEPTIQTGDDAEVIMDRLHRVDHSRVAIAFVDPDADFGRFNKILLDPLDLSDVEIVQPQRSAANRRNDWTLSDQNKENLARAFREVFERELGETGDYPIVTEPGPDVLRISAAVTGIAPNAAMDDNRSRPVGRTRVYTEGAGSMRIAFGFADSETDKVLAIIKDARSGSPTWGPNNRVSNMSDVRFMFGHWARMVRARLDIVHGY